MLFPNNYDKSWNEFERYVKMGQSTIVSKIICSKVEKHDTTPNRGMVAEDDRTCRDGHVDLFGQRKFLVREKTLSMLTVDWKALMDYVDETEKNDLITHGFDDLKKIDNRQRSFLFVPVE